jgi:nucleotide-binding universal stress UspA family protein
LGSHFGVGITFAILGSIVGGQAVVVTHEAIQSRPEVRVPRVPTDRWCLRNGHECRQTQEGRKMIADSDPETTSARPVSNRLILVGVDGSAPSKAALSWALRQAEMSGARLLAVTAWQAPARVDGGPGPEDVDWQKHAEVAQSLVIQQIVGDQPEVAVNTLIEQGHPALVLVEEARDAELLVVGNRGLGEFVGMLLGSVSEYCVAHAPCPVAVVPAPFRPVI